MVKTYRLAALENASRVELIVALYDGLIRFLGDAAAAAALGDVTGRREGARRALDILVHLQAILRPDVGGRPAEVLAEFYAAIFATILNASKSAAPGEFHHAIRCIRTVRQAWHQVAQDPTVANVMPHNLQTKEERILSGGRDVAMTQADRAAVVSRWLA